MSANEETQMNIPTFHFDEANSDEEYAYIDVLGGATVVIKRGDNGLSVEVFPAQVSDSPVAEMWATWAELNPEETEK
jgi:hypothetical protein